MREGIGEKIRRGVVDLAVTVHPLGAAASTRFDEEMAKSYMEKAGHFARDFGLPHGLSALALLKLPGVMTEEDPSLGEGAKEISSLALSALADALTNLLEMRRREGEKLGKVLLREFNELSGHRDWIHKHREEINKKHGEKLRARISDWMDGSWAAMDETRLYQEVAYYLDRSDITEELDRLSSHLKQCEDALFSEAAKSSGKRLEFLAQELGREVNTIGAKSDQAQVTSRVVEMKLALEKIREQVQNLE
jgi:uncharacterized protein (TIGR00255 family)